MSEKYCRAVAEGRATRPLGFLACERCGGHDPCTLHHRRKRSHLPKNRLWEPSNCVILCGHGTAGCHGWVEHNPAAALEEGWHVPSWMEPAEVAVKLWYADEPMYLRDSGGYGLTPLTKGDNDGMLAGQLNNP